MSNSRNLMKLNNLGKIIEKIPAQDILSFFKVLGEAYKETQITKREIEKVHAMRDVLLAQIKSKENILNKLCDLIFEERKDTIDKIFSVIHKGIESGKDEVINKGLESLANIVSSSPFKDINTLSNLLDKQGKIEM